MADAPEESFETAEEKLHMKHRKEVKDLQGEIARLKHGVPKGDKKRKKEVTGQVALMEAELEEKHQKELQQLQQSQIQVDGLTGQLSSLTAEAGDEADTGDAQKQKKSTKAQKRREKKAQKEKERVKQIEEQEEDNLLGPRHIEAEQMKTILAERTLTIFEVPSDGNCLYAAVAHQLERTNVKEASTASLRTLAADHMRKHQQEFLPFLYKEDTGEPYTEGEYAEYCDRLENSPEWGGQLEIRALANELRVPIEVVQAHSPSVVVGEEFPGESLVITYHRHVFGLGEHYNSVTTKLPEDDQADDFS